ncbi:MAG: nucleotidyl transferase AbiEii/AbiGii toxin family protein, partial [Bacteroidota bacterium]
MKLDLTNDECLVAAPVRRRIHLPYSDSVDPAEVACYGYEEIFAEKIRALGERLRPRDLYDVIHIYRREDLRPAPASVRKILEEKCRYKNVPFPTLEDLNREPRRSELETEWENMLGHQLPILPPFRQFWDEVPEVFAWMLEQRAPALLPSIAGEEGESRPATFPVPPPTHIPLIRGGLSRPAPQPARQFVKPARVLEVIQFAGANRLCVLLGYNGTKRLIEPYALRTT